MAGKLRVASWLVWLLFLCVIQSAIQKNDYKCPEDSFLNTLKYVCQKCKTCKNGEFVARKCNTVDDAECAVCPNSTFSKNKNANECRNCTYCETGYIRHCNTTDDAVCSAKTTDENASDDKGGGSSQNWIIPASMLLIGVPATFWAVRRCRQQRRRRRRRDTEESVGRAPEEQELAAT